MAIRIGIAGIAGRMGRMVAEAAAEAGFVLAGGFDRPGSVTTIPAQASIEALASVSDVVIDFTHASAVGGHARALADAGVAWVLGTTGLAPADQEAVAIAAGRIAVVQAANFSPGVNLVLALAERLAAALPAREYDAEILEMHHRQKVDAPSGTALALGRAVARGRGVVFEAMRDAARDGETGARRPGGIGFAALRGGQVVGEHTVLFAGDSEHIAITHRAFDRKGFAEGAVRAAGWVAGRAPGLFDMRDVLGMR